MRTICPFCDAEFRAADDLPAGKRVRCPECNRGFDPDSLDGPAGRPSKSGGKNANLALFVLLPVGLLILVGGLVAGGYFAFHHLFQAGGGANAVMVDAKGKNLKPPPAPKAQGQQGGVDEPVHIAVGQTAPDIEGVDSDGKKFKLSDYRGKVVVLDFWAGW